MPSVLPSSPNILLSKYFNTLIDAQELVKAVIDIEIASGRAPNCTCSYTPPEDASEATLTELCSPTPGLVFPTNRLSPPIVTTKHVQQFLDILKSFST